MFAFLAQSKVYLAEIILSEAISNHVRCAHDPDKKGSLLWKRTWCLKKVTNSISRVAVFLSIRSNEEKRDGGANDPSFPCTPSLSGTGPIMCKNVACTHHLLVVWIEGLVN